MSQDGRNGVGEVPYNFLYEDQLWNFSNLDSTEGCKRNEDKILFQSNPENLTDPVQKIKEGRGKALKGSSSKGKEEDSDHEIHIMIERQRRKKMRDMFSNLHSLLPQLPMKVDKSTIVDEAAKYIKTLQETLQQLEKKKADRVGAVSVVPIIKPSLTLALQPPVADSREAFLADQGKILADLQRNPSTVVPIPQVTTNHFQSWVSPNITLNVTGEDAQIGICTAKKQGLLPAILVVLEKHQLDMVSAHISSDHFKVMYMIHANANRIRVQFPEASMIEDVYKLAAEEMRLLLSA